ncbi:Calcium-dependent protein kinase 2 (PfCDPK2) [Durusdinium trenchii]
MTGKIAASSVAAAIVVWGMRRLLRKKRFAKAVSCQNFISNVSDIGVSVKNVLVNTMTSFVGTPASNETRSSGIDESFEPRAEESELPLAIQSKVLRHISFHDVYDIGKEGKEEVLGTGMHGAVLVAKHRKSGRRVAAKCLEEPDTNTLPEEVTLYLRLSHPNVCRLLQAFVEKNGEIWICMELCAGGELFELAAGTSSVKREGASMLDTEARIAVLVKQMAAAIRYIHSMGMVHRDIKLENWVFASPQQERLKLIDFGLATQIVTEGRAKKLMQMCGTCYYVAPEIIGLKDGAICKGDGYGQEVDVWALGVLIYMLVSGMPPFNGKNHADVIWNIANFKYCDDPLAEHFEGRRWENVSPQCKDLIRRCMEREPEKRLTAAGVQMHPWLCQVASGQMPLMALAPVLKDLCFAGTRMSKCTALAHICGSLASTIYLSPETWTLYKDYFMALECLETLAPKGALSISKLVAAFEEVVAQPEKEKSNGSELAHVDSFRSIAALDRTGDGRLHFFEFLGAMIGAGRIQIHEADVADVFAAFDVDRDGIISEKDMTSIMKDQEAQVLNRTTSSENLAFPIEDRTTLLEALNRKPCWASELPMPPAVVPPKPVEAAPNPPQMQKLLSKAKLQMEWQVQRQVAYRDVRSAVKLKSLNRGYRTPDPSPTRNAEKEEDQTSGAGLGSPRHRISKAAQSMVQLSDLDWRKRSEAEPSKRPN